MNDPVDYSQLLGCGVYLLCRRGQVVYVGQSVNLLKRLYTHQNKRWIEFDQVSVVSCERWELSRIEASLIEKYAPIGNTRKVRGWPERRVDLAKLGLKRRSFARRRV